MTFAFWLLSYIHVLIGINSDTIGIIQSIIIGILLMTKQSEQKLIMGIYIIVLMFIQCFISTIPLAVYLAITVIFTCLAVLNYFAPKIDTSNLNPQTIQLCFYCGDGGNIKMRIGEIIGFMPVKSVVVSAHDIALRIREHKFQIVPAQSIIDSKNYLVVDTHIVADDLFIERMLKMNNKDAPNNLFSSHCMDIPSLINSYYAPKNILEKIPSVYMRRILSGRQPKNI